MVKIAAKAAATPGAAVATAPAPADAAKADKKSKKRSDFQTWPEWCEYKKLKCIQRAQKFSAQAEDWEKRKAGEQVAKAEKKIKRLAKLTSMLDALKAELSASGIKV